MESQGAVQRVTQEFQSHHNMLLMTMRRQAGSISKAIMEAVQNSIDAGANKILIDFTPTALSVQDDGRGFETLEAINKYFNVFGQPHEEGDAIFGYYRLGRGQIFAFMATEWRTNTFQMNVDIEKYGTKWELVTGLPPVAGCTVKGELYRPLDEYEYNYQCNALKELVAFSEVPIYLNGKLISSAPAELEKKNFWDYVDEDVFIKRGDINSTELKVYNLGMLVRSFHAKSMGLAGVVVSRKRLEVNMARNDIQTNECAVWARIQAAIKKVAGGDLTKKKKLNNYQADFLAARLVARELSLEEVLDSPLLTDICGRAVSFRKLITLERVSFCPENQRREGEFASNFGMTVFSDAMLERFKCCDEQEFFDLLAERCHKFSLQEQIEKIQIIPFEELSRTIDKSVNIIEDQKLNRYELLMLNMLRAVNGVLLEKMAEHLGEYNTPQERAIFACYSPSMEMHTDGKSYINVNCGLLYDAYYDSTVAYKLVLLLLHEYLHDSNDRDGHVHSLSRWIVALWICVSPF